MTRRLLLLLAATRPWATGGFAQELPKAETDSNAGRDSAVLDVVLKDLLSWPDSRPDSPLNHPKKQIHFSPEALTGQLKGSDILGRRRHPSEWGKLSPVELALAREATEDLARRSQGKVTFKDLGLKDRRIVLWDKARADAKRDPPRHPAEPQVFCAYPPGYSQDRQLAIVVVTFPWGGWHYGSGTCVLSRKGGEWVVLIRDFSYSG